MSLLTRRQLGTTLPSQRVAVGVAILLAILAVGWRTPLPGLHPEQLSLALSFGHDQSVLSVLVFGLTPFFTFLACAEFARVTAPSFARWEINSFRNSSRIAVTVGICSLIFVAAEAYGLAIYFVSIGYMPDQPGAVAACAAAMVGGTALMIWLSDEFTLPNLQGFWLLTALTSVATIPDRASFLVDISRSGGMSGNQLSGIVLFIAAGLALAVFANLLLAKNSQLTGMQRSSILLWPTHLAGGVAAAALMVLPNDLTSWRWLRISFYETAYLSITAVFIPVFVILYARLFKRLNPDRRHGSWPVLMAIAAIQMVLCLGAWLMPIFWGFGPNVSGAELLVFATACLAIRTSPQAAHA